MALMVECRTPDGKTVMKYPVDARESGYEIRRINGKVEAVLPEGPAEISAEKEPKSKKGKRG